jgi:hypothetical protein
VTEEAVTDFRGRRGIPEAGEPQEVPDCPVTPLGHNGSHYYFLSPDGQWRVLHFRELRSDAGQVSLFDGDVGYLKAAWPRFDKDGAQLDDFNPKRAHAALVSLCARAGMWDPDTPVHGRGVWRGPQGRLLCHNGDTVLFADGQTKPAGLRLGAAIYPRKPAIPAPAIEPVPAVAAKEWRAGFRAWHYAPLGLGPESGPISLAADLLFGATSLAMLGAAPPWRVHVLIQGIHGTGKSTLLGAIGQALGPLAVTMNNFSEAGFRNTLANEARPVLVDEAEADDNGVMSQIVRVIRQMSGGEGVKGLRGEASGGHRSFDIAGSAFLGCINMPDLKPQDLSRFLVLELRRGSAATETAAKRAIARAGELSAGLRARAFYGWPRFEANLALLRAALFGRGCNTRQADLLGALLAAGAMMSEEHGIDAGHADDLAEIVEPLIRAMAAESEDRSDARSCWIQLLSSPVMAWRSGEAQTIGSLLLDSCQPNGTDTRTLLAHKCGIRVELGEASKTHPEAPCLYIANQHQFLREVYRDTNWREGGWRQSLARLDGAMPSEKPIRIGMLQQRAVAVPMKRLPQGPPMTEAEDGG